MTKYVKKQTVKYPSEALIFDPDVEQVDSLVGSVDSHVEILTARRGEVGSQIQQMLRSGASTIHVLGHGKPGQVELAGYVLDEDAWERIVSDVEAASPDSGLKLVGKKNSGEVALYQEGLESNQKLEINFWSCQTGEGPMGKKYTQRVADMCDAKVNASSGLVGHEKMGGSWELDVMTYPKIPFSASGISAFENVLSSSPDHTVSLSQIEGGLKFVDGKTYAVTGVTKEKIVELVADSHVVSISIAGTLAGTAVTVNASQFAALGSPKVEEFTSAITVNDTATAFAAVFNAQVIEGMVQHLDHKQQDASAKLPTISANLTNANPREASLCFSD